jgi:hypothetical protein
MVSDDNNAPLTFAVAFSPRDQIQELLAVLNYNELVAYYARMSDGDRIVKECYKNSYAIALKNISNFNRKS